MVLLRILICGGLALAQTPQTNPAPAIAITGDVTSPKQITGTDLAKMPHRTITVHTEDGTTTQYEGVPLPDLLAQAGVPFGKDLRGKALATYVVAKARDGYQVLYGLGELDPNLGNAGILVADKRDGSALSGNQGPFRLVCPNDKAEARSIRMVETLEVVRLRK